VTVTAGPGRIGLLSSADVMSNGVRFEAWMGLMSWPAVIARAFDCAIPMAFEDISRPPGLSHPHFPCCLALYP
jgi:hypothetical protein